MINPDELTGESVENFRLERKMKRQAFNDICVQFGLNAGRSLARMCNIEKNDIWKPGDREAVAAAINHISANVELPLTSPERKPRKSKNNSSTLTDDSVIVPVWCDEDDDVDESLVDVLGPDVEAANNNALLGVASWNVDGPVAPDATPITIVNDDDEDLTSWAALEFDGVSSEVDADADERAFVVTNSLIQTAKRCRRKWWLSWYRGLAPRNENLLNTRATGNRIHKALQAWYVPDGETPVDPRDALERILTEDWTKIVTAAKARGHDEFVIADLTDKFNKAAGLERAMIEGYVQWLQETGADSQLKIIASETTLKAHLYDHVRADGQVTPVYAMGLLDVRAYRTTDGANLFVDHKAQPLDAKVLTPIGWTTMGELEVGSQVVTPDGSITTVTGVYPQGTVPIYELTLADKTKVRSCDDHLWNVKAHGHQGTMKTLSLHDIRTSKSHYWMPLISGTLPFKQEFPVDPYVLGVLLGDGNLAHGGVGFSSIDLDIVEHVRSRLPNELKLNDPVVDSRSAVRTYSISTGTQRIPNVIREYLRREHLDVKAHLKHVPDAYLWADDQSRLDLLRGLMDTDGHVGIRGQTLLVSTSKALRDAVVHLAQSLGGTATCNSYAPKNPDVTTYIGRNAYSGHTVWICNIQMPHDVAPFTCERKLHQWTETRRRVPSRKLRNVDYVGDFEAQCITVDHPSQCYITDNFTVTHNTVGSLTAPVAMLPQNEQMLHYLLLEWLASEDGEMHCDGALYNMLRRVKRTTTAKPPFYDRYEVRHNKYELESYKRRLIAETHDMLTMIEALDAGADPMDVAYPSPNNDCTWSCDFHSICSMFDDGSRAEDALESLFVQVDPNARYESTKGIE